MSSICVVGVDRVTFAREARIHYIWVCLLETKEKVGNSTVTSYQRIFNIVFKKKKFL